MLNRTVVGFFARWRKETAGDFAILPVISDTFTTFAMTGTSVGASTVRFGITSHALTSS
jgi:hypothetical protein